MPSYQLLVTLEKTS